MDLYGYQHNALSIIVTASNSADDLGKFFDQATSHFQNKDELIPFLYPDDKHIQQIQGPVFCFEFADDAQMQQFIQLYAVVICKPQVAINYNTTMAEQGLEDKFAAENNLFTIGQVHNLTSDDPWDKRSLHEKLNGKAPSGYKTQRNDDMTSDDSFSMEPAMKAALGAHTSDNGAANVAASVIRKVNGDENNAILKMQFEFIKKNIEVKWEGTSVSGTNLINLLGDLATSSKYKPFFKVGSTPQFTLEMMDGSCTSPAIMNGDRTDISSIFPHDHKTEQ